MAKEIKTILKDLQDIIDIQGGDGTWNYDSYMYGLYNGLVLAKSIVADEPVEFRDAPTAWVGKSSAERAKIKLRAANPALQTAWEEYKILEALLDGTESDPITTS